MAQGVVVLGAGLAGLVAAHALTRQGQAVTVLEARDRPGGRVLTLRDALAEGLYVEAGARYVLDHHDLTVGYARQFGIGLVPLAASGQGYEIGGRLVLPQPGAAVDWGIDLTAEERALGPDGLLFRYLGGLIATVGDAAAPDWPSVALLAHDDVSVERYLIDAGASAGAIRLMGLGGLLNLVGEGLDSISLLWALRHLADLYRTRQLFLIDGGTDRLPAALAAELDGQIRYGATVVGIARDDDGVEVSYLDGGQPRQIRGARVICTLPFPALRRVAVTPPFSVEKRRAIEELPATAVTRVFVQARTRFWEAQGLPGAVTSDGDLGTCTVVTAQQPGVHGVIESYQAGEAARRTGALAPAARLAATSGALDRLYPGIDAAGDGGTAYVWQDDPWAGGAYSWARPGQMRTIVPHVGIAEGRVLFAGDHASPWPGWIQGALWSGLRAVEAVVAQL